MIDPRKITTEQVMAAYARLRSAGPNPIGSRDHTEAYKREVRGSRFTVGIIDTCLEKLSQLDVQKISEGLHTPDGKQVTMERIVLQWAAFAFDETIDASSRMRALEKLEKLITVIAASHPLIAREIEAMRTRRTSPLPNEQPASPAVPKSSKLAPQKLRGDFIYTDFLKGKTG